MITIDGSFGEGGGQILRSSLALSLVTGTPVRIFNIRAGRKKPGLKLQHLTAVRAAAEVGDADVRGDAAGSMDLTFEPSRIKSGEFAFRMGSAGSTTLVLQTVLPALLFAEAASTADLEGGTHNPFAPPFDFLANAYLPQLRRMGATVNAKLDRYGFYPAGGGRFTVNVQPVESWRGIELLERGKIQKRRVRAMVANLPTHIAQRECDTIARKSGWDKSCFQVVEITDSPGPGNVVVIEVEFENVTEVFTGFGKRGVKAEQVAAGVWRDIRAYLKTDVPVGAYLADQLLLPMGLAAHFGGGESSFRTMALSQHSTTHIDILKRFLNIEIRVEAENKDVLVKIDG